MASAIANFSGVRVADQSRDVDADYQRAGRFMTLCIDVRLSEQGRAGRPLEPRQDDLDPTVGRDQH